MLGSFDLSSEDLEDILCNLEDILYNQASKINPGNDKDSSKIYSMMLAESSSLTIYYNVVGILEIHSDYGWGISEKFTVSLAGHSMEYSSSDKRLLKRVKAQFKSEDESEEPRDLTIKKILPDKKSEIAHYAELFTNLFMGTQKDYWFDMKNYSVN